MAALTKARVMRAPIPIPTSYTGWEIDNRVSRAKHSHRPITAQSLGSP